MPARMTVSFILVHSVMLDRNIQAGSSASAAAIPPFPLPAPKVSPTKRIDAEAIRRNPPQLLSRSEAAAFLNISLRTLSALLARRTIRVVKIGDRRILRLRDLEDFVEQRTT